MIQYVKGNLLDAETEALVNTVNTVGVMGKGIALQFKQRYKSNTRAYELACKQQELEVGKMLVVEDADIQGKRIIINFPTKKHWKQPSKYEYIEEGLKALRNELLSREIGSVALPPLGCGNGGLDWIKVNSLIENALADLAVKIFVYEPNEEIKALLQQEEQSKKLNLTPVRALFLSLLYAYEAQGEQISLFVANKLAYFLQRSGEPLKVQFEAHIYGPYSPKINHVLYDMNGVFLSGLEQNQVKPFESISLKYDRLPEIEDFISTQVSSEQRQRLSNVIQLIRGFESTHALELLATVDYIVHNKGAKTASEVKFELQKWSSRKAGMFSDEHIELALEHLTQYQQAIFVQ